MIAEALPVLHRHVPASSAYLSTPRRGVANTVCVDTNGGVVLSALDHVDRHKEELLVANRLAAGIDNRRRLLRQIGAASTSTLDNFQRLKKTKITEIKHGLSPKSDFL